MERSRHLQGLYDAEPMTRGNVGDAEYLSARNNYVHAPGNMSAYRVSDLIIVDTTDALLSAITGSRAVKHLVNRYNAGNDPVTKFHRQSTARGVLYGA